MLNVTFWHEVELAAEEEDSDSVMSEVPEAAGRRLDRLDTAVEAFGDGIGDPVKEVGQQMRQVIFEGPGHLLDLVQARVDRALIPIVVVSVGSVRQVSHIL